MKYSLIIAVFLLGIAAGDNHEVTTNDDDDNVDPVATVATVVGNPEFTSPKKSFYL